MAFVEKIIRTLETRDERFLSLVGMFLAFVFVRTFLEVCLGVGKMTTFLAMAVHYPLFYLSLVITLSLILELFSGETVRKIIKVLVPFYGIIILPPIIDLMVFGPGGFKPKYLFFSGANWHNITTAFFTFFSTSALNKGITLGMRIEIALGILGVGVYVWWKSRNVLRAVVAMAATYIAVFIYVSQPIFHRAAKRLALWLGFVRAGSLGWSQFWMLILTLQFPVVLIAWDWSKFVAVFGNIRPWRVLHFWLMFFLGLWIGIRGRLSLVPELNFYDLVFSLMSIFFAWEFSVVVNDIVDTGIDHLSNPSRPLVKGALSLFEMYHLAGFYLFWAVMAALLTNSRLAFMIFTFMALYWLYSVPPVRLKKIPFLATAVIALGCIALMMGGVIIAGRQPIALPAKLVLAVFVVFTLSFNSKDLKDFEGDKVEGIKTIMTIFGPDNGRKMISFLVLISYILFPMILGMWDLGVLLVSMIFGLMTAGVIFRKIGEWAIFMIYFSYSLILFIVFDEVFKSALYIN